MKFEITVSVQIYPIYIMKFFWWINIKEMEEFFIKEVGFNKYVLINSIRIVNEQFLLFLFF